MTTPIENTPVSADLKKKISFKVFGVGGAGCNAVSAMARGEFTDVDFSAINTDSQAMETVWVLNKLVLGAKLTRGLGTGGDPELGRASAELDLENLRTQCAGADIIFILAGLGGGTGTGASPLLARVAKESGALVLGIVTLPFEFEGTRRARQAQLGLQQLKTAADAVICLPNQKLFQLLDEKTSVLESFKISNGLLAQGVRGIWQLLTQNGLINVDFADLCSVTRGRHAESSFATAEASGENRAEQVIEKLLAHPLLERGQVLGESDAVLVSLIGGPDLTMSEVSRLMEQLNRQCENAHLILGAAIDEKFSNRLSATLIASRNHRDEVKVPLPPALESHRGNLPVVETSETQFQEHAITSRPHSRFVAPAPALSDENKEQLFSRQRGSRSRKKSAHRNQRELPLEIISKGRFDKSEPTIRHGEDLDVPTYIRRGVALN